MGSVGDCYDNAMAESCPQLCQEHPSVRARDDLSQLEHSNPLERSQGLLAPGLPQ